MTPVGTWLAIAAGFAGPLVAVVATWLAVVRVYRRDPVAVTGVMVTAFLVKVVGFSAYIAVMIKVLALPVRPFGLSFLVSFIVLYAIEAALFARFFRGAIAGGR